MTAVRNSLLLALAGLALTGIGPVLYVMTMDHPGLRASGLAATAPMVLGAAIAALCARVDRRWRVRLVAVGAVLLATLWVVAFGWFSTLPEAGPRAAPASVADFSLLDQNGEPVSLRERCTSGPVLLVFFRGDW